jgi:hypothetical protein
MKNVNFLKGSLGLNNVADSVRIGHNEDTGIVDLAEAYNIDIDNSGRISRCEGFTATSRTENIHSLWAEKEYCLYMSGDSLYRLKSDYSRVGLRSYMTPGAVVDYAYVDGIVYYVNGFEHGYVNGDVTYAWQKGEYIGPTTFKQYSNPPYGHLICYYNGRMFVAQDNVLWYSEPYAFGAFDLARNYFQFSTRIKMVKAVEDGLFISDSQRVYFYRFDEPTDFKQTVMYDYPVIEGSAALGDAVSLQLPSTVISEFSKVDGPVLVCATEKGICIGASSGIFKSLTLDKVTYPTANRAAAVIDGTAYTCLLQE